MSHSSVANFIHVQAVRKLWKSVKIWQSYGALKGGNYFETQCRNGFSDIYCLYDVKLLAARRCFSPSLATFHCACAVSTVPYHYSRFKIWRHIWIRHTRFPIMTWWFWEHPTTLSDFRDIIFAHAQYGYNCTSGSKFVTDKWSSDSDFQ